MTERHFGAYGLICWRIWASIFPSTENRTAAFSSFFFWRSTICQKHGLRGQTDLASNPICCICRMGSMGQVMLSPFKENKWWTYHLASMGPGRECKWWVKDGCDPLTTAGTMIRDLKAFSKPHMLQKVYEDIMTPSSFTNLNCQTLFEVQY